jgi:hypothetical protein
MSDKIKRTIDFPADLYEQLRKLAASEDRSVNSQVVQLLKAALADMKGRD